MHGGFHTEHRQVYLCMQCPCHVCPFDLDREPVLNSQPVQPSQPAAAPAEEPESAEVKAPAAALAAAPAEEPEFESAEEEVSEIRMDFQPVNPSQPAATPAEVDNGSGQVSLSNSRSTNGSWSMVFQ